MNSRKLKRRIASFFALAIWLSMIGFGFVHWGEHQTVMLLAGGAVAAVISMQLDYYARREDWILFLNPEEFEDLWFKYPNEPAEYENDLVTNLNDYSLMEASIRTDRSDAAFKSQRDAWEWLLDDQHKESPVATYIKKQIRKNSEPSDLG